MEVTSTRPNTEAAQLVAASLQNVRFKERRLREAQSDVRNEVVYFSPVIRIDRETQSAIIQYRDGSTGEVQREYPTPPKKGAYKDIQVEVKAPEQSEPEVLEKVAAPAKEQKQVRSVDESV